MRAYNVALFVHFLGLITLFAALAIQQRAAARIRQAITAEHVTLWIELLRMANPMFPAGSAMLLLSGLFMTFQSWTPTTAWVVVAFFGQICFGLLGGLNGRRIGAIAVAVGEETGTAITSAAARLIGDPTPWTVLSTVNGGAIGIVWLMINKPGWTGSIAIMLGFALAGGIVGYVMSRPRASSSGAVPA